MLYYPTFYMFRGELHSVWPRVFGEKAVTLFYISSNNIWSFIYSIIFFYLLIIYLYLYPAPYFYFIFYLYLYPASYFYLLQHYLSSAPAMLLPHESTVSHETQQEQVSVAVVNVLRNTIVHIFLPREMQAQIISLSRSIFCVSKFKYNLYRKVGVYFAYIDKLKYNLGLNLIREFSLLASSPRLNTSITEGTRWEAFLRNEKIRSEKLSSF